MNATRSDYLDAHSISRQYFLVPRTYADALGGVRWSDKADFLVFPRDEAIVSLESLAEFLEGFATQRPLLSFGSMVHWAVLLNTMSADRHFDRLRTAFRTLGASWRNAGALAGMMSDSLLPAANPPPVAILCSRLRERAFPIRWFSGALNSISNDAEEPPHSVIEFEQHVRLELGVLSDDDLEEWLKSGRGPVRHAGEALAREQPPPRVLASILEQLFERPRLAGAAAHLSQMIVALTVPPRRQSPEQLPLGGYVDVVTHGSVDRLLPSQHALDDLEFLRRFSENELLFFRREEPPAQQSQELVVVLDQGVRAWGDVRLVLTAAALALTQHADRKKMACRLVCTSQPRSFLSPLEEPEPRLGPVLEASDFTRNPCLALEGVLEWPSPMPRDIVLLTHPFSLSETDVQAAARRLRVQDRLFALTVDAQGNAELVQLHHGLPVRLRSFRVDFTPAKTIAAKPAVAASSWSGDVEPIGWPFRFGTDSPIRLFDFDCSGQHLLVVTETSMLYLWNLENGDLEILPRAQTARGRVETWHDLTGVVAGFALQAVVDSHHVVAHYDLARRRCVVHTTVAPSWMPAYLSYVPSLHSVALMHDLRNQPLLTIDLATGETAQGAYMQEVGRKADRMHYDVTIDVSASTPPRDVDRRARQAIRHIQSAGRHSQALAPVYDRKNWPSGPGRTYHFDADRAALVIADGATCWPAITPHTEGKPTFVNAKIEAVHLATSTLAVCYRPMPSHEDNKHLAFFRGPTGDFLRETRWLAAAAQALRTFCLSPDGAKVALLRSANHVEVQWTDRPERILHTRPGGFGTQSRLWVGDDGMLLCCGRKGFAWHLLQWSQGVLEVHSDMRRSKALALREFHHPRIKEFLSNGDPEEATGVGASNLGNERSVKALARHGAVFVLDRFGQIKILDAQPSLVFQFFAHGDSWSAWMPDGTRHGHGMVHHWPNTPHALCAMGRALRQATGGQRP